MIRQIPLAADRQPRFNIMLSADAQGGGVSAVVAVRWCFCPKVFNRVKRHHEFPPYLLLVVSCDNVEVERRLVPLSDEMTYFSFQKAGTHLIQATVVQTSDIEQLRKRILRSCRGPRYLYAVRKESYRDTGDRLYRSQEFRDELNVGFLERTGYGETKVHVSPEFFAAKPRWNWVWRWGNFMHDTGPRDQCDFRRRFWVLGPPKLLYVILYAFVVCLARLFAAVLLRYGVGARQVDFRAIIHPWIYATEDVWSECGYGPNGWSIFILRSDGRLRWPGFWIFTPIIFLPLVGIALLCLPPLAATILTAEIVAGALVIIGLGTGVMTATTYAMAHWLHFDWDDYQKRRQEAKARQRVEAYAETYQPLVCQGSPLPATIDAIPRERRTLALRFNAVKARICRPFQSNW